VWANVDLNLKLGAVCSYRWDLQVSGLCCDFSVCVCVCVCVSVSVSVCVYVCVCVCFKLRVGIG
jgi:hypothetical protein